MWWKREPFRLIQTNLREIDTDLDPERLVADVVETGGTVLLFNCGGIVANDPTALEFHYRNPYLRGDLVGDVLRECKKRGICFIGRFDFSKATRFILLDIQSGFTGDWMGKWSIIMGKSIPVSMGLTNKNARSKS